MAISSAPPTPTSVATPPARGVRRRPHAWLTLLVFASGAQAIVTQSLLLREAMVLMYGSEFAWSIVLFAWLLGVAVGAAIGGRLAPRLACWGWTDALLAGALLALSLAAGLEIWVFRGARAWLGVGPGELLPLSQTVAAALLLVTPASMLVGIALPLACSVKAAAPAAAPAPALPLGRVYAIEAAGSLLGGAVFSFWAVEHLAQVQIALLSGAVSAAAAGAFLVAQSTTAAGHGQRGRRLQLAGGAVLVGMPVAAVLLAATYGGVLDRWLVERRWKQLAPGYELIATTESKYQNLALGRRAGQFSLYCDGQVTADFPDPYTFAPLAHFWLCQHPAPGRVLVLGGGTEGLLCEMLRHPVAHVDCVEPDPAQLQLVRQYLSAADREALSDPRVTVHIADARHYIKSQRAQFDLVLARLPEPTSALRARFYTDEFYAELRRAMTPLSVLCLTAAAAPTELSEIAREYLAALRATLRRHFSEVIVGWGDPAHILAATTAGLLTTDPAEMNARYSRRGINSEIFDPLWFDGATDWLEPDKLARRAADLDAAGDVSISTDLHPSVYLQRLVIWEAATGAAAGRVAGDSTRWLGKWHSAGTIARIGSIRMIEIVFALATAGMLVLVVSRSRCGARGGWAPGAVALSVATTGLTTMALSMFWLFAFQNLYGYVYQRIGWIVALFMAGLVVGCALASRETGRAWPRLIWIDVLLAALALSVPFVWRLLAGLQSGPGTSAVVEVCVSVMVVITGLLGGAAFAVAGRVQLNFSPSTGAAAGTIVGADHVGACLGALLCGILLVPVFGVRATAWLLAGVKLVSALLLGINARCSRHQKQALTEPQRQRKSAPRR